MKNLFYCLFFAFCGLLCSCSSLNERCIKDLTDLVEKVEKEGDSYNAEQWEVVFSQYEEVVSQLGKEEKLTPEQTKQVSQLQGRMAAVSTKGAAKKLGKSLKNIVENAGNIVGGFLEGLSE